jgi:signal transduction histidine kinase
VLQALANMPANATEVGPADGAAGAPADEATDLARRLAQLLGATHLHMAPDAPGDAQSAWLLVAYGPQTRGQAQAWPLHSLAAFAKDMRRLVQQASYVDSLQAEIAAHERVRIGRDLHDSALQPYLGLKFAIDVVAQRCTPDNPLHAQVADLRRFCETELNELRDTVSLLRNGEVRGDNTLVPALLRQAKRFGALFGIQITLQLPDELVTSRPRCCTW